MIYIAGKFGGGKFGEFGESSVIRQTKAIQIHLCIRQTLITSEFAKLSRYMVKGALDKCLQLELYCILDVMWCYYDGFPVV